MKWLSPIALSCTPTSSDALTRCTPVRTEERARRVAVVKRASETAANRARVGVALHVHRRALVGEILGAAHDNVRAVSTSRERTEITGVPPKGFACIEPFDGPGVAAYG